MQGPVGIFVKREMFFTGVVTSTLAIFWSSLISQAIFGGLYFKNLQGYM